ncbi:MAG TPA: amidohydrolase family protein [Methanoregulaceae archaeon]|nr:amidohydrolase family protein [Methanoregulaceae archaeon]
MSDHEMTVSGHALLGERFEMSPVTIVVKSGVITHIEHEPHPPAAWICPAFFNAHTHLGDTIAMDVNLAGTDLVSVVTPPNGLKHQLLSIAPRSDLVSGMRASIRTMLSSGTAGCADFREGGVPGVRALEEAAGDQLPGLVVFGRDGGEELSQGLGISSARDVPGLESLVDNARKKGKLLAFHAGEKDPGDVDSALSFDPDLLIHCTHATRNHLRACADRDIPVAVCPRSNWAFGVTGSSERPPIHEMIELGCRFFLGTDNAMVVQPDMLAELAFTSFVYGVEPRALLRAAVSGACLAHNDFSIREGSRAAFFLLDPGRSNMRFSRDPLSTIAKRATSMDIVKKVFISKR